MEIDFDALTSEQQRNYDLLLKQSEKLVALIKGKDDESALEELIAARQQTIELMAGTDEKIKKAGGKQKPKALEKLAKTIEKILALDRESGKLLETSKSSLAEKIKTISKSVAALKGYGPGTGPGSGKFISIRK